MGKQTEKKAAEEAAKKEEARLADAEKKAAEEAEEKAWDKATAKHLEAVRCVTLPNSGTEGTAVVAPGGVFKATSEQIKKLVGNGAAMKTNKPVSTDKELAELHAAHTNKLRKMEKERLESIRRSNN